MYTVPKLAVFHTFWEDPLIPGARFPELTRARITDQLQLDRIVSAGVAYVDPTIDLANVAFTGGTIAGMTSIAVANGAALSAYSGGEIAGLVPGSTGGGEIAAPASAHLVVALRENDGSDSFSIVSGGGNYSADATLDTLVAAFRANGHVELPGGYLNVGAGNLAVAAAGLNQIIQAPVASIGFFDTDAASQGFAGSAWVESGTAYGFYTRSGIDGSAVSLDYLATKSASGVTKHSWRLAGNERMTLDEPLGVGNPEWTLTGTNVYAALDRSTSARRAQYQLTTAGNLNWAIGVADSDEFGGVTGAEFFIAQGPGSAAAIWINAVRHVGFGTTTPDDLVHVNGGNLRVGAFDGSAGGGADDGVWLAADGRISASRAGNVASLRRRASDGDIMAFFRDTTLVGRISVTGSATTYHTSSDYRLKPDAFVLDADQAGDFIDGLTPRGWAKFANGDAGTWGFFAHEYQEHSPLAVYGAKDGEDMQSMAYSDPKLMAALVATSQDLRARVAVLENA
jgi:hypothetical protein